MIADGNGKKLAQLEQQKQEKIDALEYASGQRGFKPTSSCAGAIEEELSLLRKREANSMAFDKKLDRRIEFLQAKKRGWYSEHCPKEVVKKVVKKKQPAKAASSSSGGGGGW